MSAPVPRRPCPVLTCRGDMAADSTMCTNCLIALPAYQRVALDGAVKAVRRQPTASNKQRLASAIRNAVFAAGQPK